jgi:hypothetical protein
VALFNTNDSITSELSISLPEIGISGNYAVKDLWNKEDKGIVSASYKAFLEPHASELMRFTKAK